MIKILVSMYITILPVIIAGISNMIVVKQNWFKKIAKPIDNNKCFRDGKRIFGNNKTWAGFVTMIICTMIAYMFCGIINMIFEPMQYMNELYINYDNKLTFNLLIGSIMGFTYVICELPNSFIKRRLDIKDGKTASGVKGFIFFIIDQIDSTTGIILVLAFLSNFGLAKIIQYIALGGLTHIGVNLILYKIRIRKNI